MLFLCKLLLLILTPREPGQKVEMSWECFLYFWGLVLDNMKPCPWCNCCWIQICAAFANNVFKRAVSTPCAEDTVLQQQRSSSSSSCILPTPSSGKFPEPWRAWHRCPIAGWAFNHSQHAEQLWVSAVTTTHCKRKLLWPKTATLIYMLRLSTEKATWHAQYVHLAIQQQQILLRPMTL